MQLLVILYVQSESSPFPVPQHVAECCFTSTETIGLLGMGAQDDHINFHTAPELWESTSEALLMLYNGPI